jgi:hypothetical protein
MWYSRRRSEYEWFIFCIYFKGVTMMKKSIEFVCKKYKWGWSVWMKIDLSKKLLASKLRSEYDAYKFIYSLNNNGSYKVLV